MAVVLQSMRAAKSGGSKEDMVLLEEVPLPARGIGRPPRPRTP